MQRAQRTSPQSSLSPEKDEARDSSQSREATYEAIGELFREKAVSFSDFVSVLSDLRRSGQKLKGSAVTQRLHELTSPEGRELHRKRLEERANNIVHLTDATVIPENETLLRRVREYDSELEEARRQIEQLLQVRDEVATVRTELAEARQREKNLLASLKDAELRLERAHIQNEEVLRLRISLARVTSKKDALAAEVQRLQESEQPAGMAAGSNEVLQLRESIKKERGQRQSSEQRLEDALRKAAQAETFRKELDEHRTALAEMLRTEDQLRAKLEIAAQDVGCLSAAEEEVAHLRKQMGEYRQQEATLRSQLIEAQTDAELVESLSAELAEQMTKMETTRVREQALVRELESAAKKAELADELEEQVRNLQEILEEYRERETEWTERRGGEEQFQRQADRLREELKSSAQALEESREREIRLSDELKAFRIRSVAKDSTAEVALQARLTSTSQALDEAHTEVEEKSREFRELQARLAQAEGSAAESRAREAELRAQLDEVARRASTAEAQLAEHIRTIDEKTRGLQGQVQETRQALSGILPAGASAIVENDVTARLAETSPNAPFVALKALLDQLQREANQAAEYKAYLQGELKKAQPEAGAASTGEIGLAGESAELRRYLAETIESELHRQEKTLHELMVREINLKAQLEKARPRTIQAQAIQSQLDGHENYRAEMLRRGEALAKLLRETVTHMRTAPTTEEA